MASWRTRGLALRFEHVEQRVDRRLAHVPPVLVFEFALDQPDFGVVEKVRRGIEIGEIDEAMTSAAAPPRIPAAPPRPRATSARASATFDRLLARVAVLQELEPLAEHLDEDIRDQHELLLPEQREQVVAGIGGNSFARLITCRKRRISSDSTPASSVSRRKPSLYSCHASPSDFAGCRKTSTSSQVM